MLITNQTVLGQKSHSIPFLHCISTELLPWSIQCFLFHICKPTVWLRLPTTLIPYKLVSHSSVPSSCGLHTFQLDLGMRSTEKNELATWGYNPYSYMVVTVGDHQLHHSTITAWLTFITAKYFHARNKISWMGMLTRLSGAILFNLASIFIHNKNPLYDISIFSALIRQD